MNLWLIVPVKPFVHGKSRLASVLNEAQRAALSRNLLTYLIDAAQRAAVCNAILVISRSQTVLDHAASLGADTLRETPAPDTPHPANNGATEHALNGALQQATAVAQAGGADAVLVLPADLPLIAPEDIAQLVEHGARQPGVVIAPSGDGGTNALLMRPPAAIDFAFGPNSFARHCALAAAAGLDRQVVETPRLRFDLDHPRDWRRWRALTQSGMVE